MTTWRDYWNGDVPVYVSERHSTAHYRRLTRDIVNLLPRPNALVLDYGCGEARGAAEISRKCRRLYLCDGSEPVRARLAAAAAAEPRMTVIAPEDMGQVADGSLDLIVMCSVLQYLDAAERDRVLALLAGKLAPGGELILADVIPEDAGAVSDAADLIQFAAEEGFLVDAVKGLIRIALSDYRKQRADLGLARYGDAEAKAMMARAGLDCRRLTRNVGPNRRRVTYAGRRPSKA